ncbi:MAG: hypothetical protein M0Z46_16365 [Actinomycetota bacterium]|nr:hypothetical protein [Actinomycetota bacterium]
MRNEDQTLQVVLPGHELDGTTWSVGVRPDPTCEDGLYTFVRRTAADGHSARSGMGGPKLWGDSAVNVWVGKSDGTPPFILIRGIPSIEEATVLTNGGEAIQIALSPEIEEFGLRFGAAALPADDPPEILRVRLADGRVVEDEIPWPRRPPIP